MFEELQIAMILSWIEKMFTGFSTVLDSLLNMNIDIPADAAITSMGVTLASMFFAMEIFSQMAQFRVDRIEEAIKIAMKFVVAKIIIENSSGIVNGIRGLMGLATGSSFSDALNGILGIIKSTTSETIDGGMFGIGYFVANIFLNIMYGVFFIVLVSIVVSIVGIFVEIALHQAIAPIALSTLCNDISRSTGIAFIKSFAAICLQLTIINAAMEAFSIIFPELEKLNFKPASGADSGMFGSIIQLLIPLVSLIALSKAIKSSSDITKRMLGA